MELNQGKINALIFDELNNLWIASSVHGGLHYFDQQSHQLHSFQNDPMDKQSISNNEVNDIALVKGTLWIATYGGGIDAYQLKYKTFKHYFSSNYFENFGLNIFTDRKKNIWICTLGSLKLYDPTADNFYNYYPQPDNPRSLGKNLSGFYEDNLGNYWTVHLTGGIRVVKSKNKFRHFHSSPESFWYTTEKNITTISANSSGHLWIGNYYNGIDVFNWNEHRIDRYFHQENDPKSLGNGSIFSIFRDSKKRMWVGSNMGGLQQFNPESKSFDTFMNKPGDTLTIAGNDVRSIAEGDHEDLWIAVHGKGVDHFDLKSKSFHHYNLKNNRLSNDFTFQVLSDSRGNLWVATGWGLNLLRKGENVFENFMFSKSDSGTVNNNYIYSIHEDGLHNIWAGTPEGLNKFDPVTQTFSHYSSGLKNTQVVSIRSDKNNNIWVGTKSGISRFDPLTQRFTNYNQSDGLLSREYNVRSSYRNEQDELIFGGAEGIDLFNPDSLTVKTNRQTVVLTDFKLFNKSVSQKGDHPIIQRHINYTRQLELNYKNNSFTFLYQAVDLPKPDKITYAYKLDGFDKDWVHAGTRTEASYTNLNPGNYTFKVKARYDNLDWSDKETSIKISIVPAWWMTTGFKILLSLLILSVTFGLLYWRIKRSRHREEILEKLVAERTVEILSKNELLKSQALTLLENDDQLKNLNSTKDKLFSILSHDLRSPFNGILGFHGLLINNYFDYSDAERIDMIKQIHLTTNHVYYLVENLLSWARIQTDDIQQFPVKFDVRNEILLKFSMYQVLAKEKGIILNHQIPENLFAFADVNLMKTTLRNLINNAIKFTPVDGTILLKVRPENDSIKISVIDNGIGISHDKINTLFNLEKIQVTYGTQGETGSGLGLVLCKEFVEKNEGFMTVESQEGEGSTFSFTIPVASPDRL